MSFLGERRSLGSPGRPRTARRTCARLLRPSFRPCAPARRSLPSSNPGCFPASFRWWCSSCPFRAMAGGKIPSESRSSSTLFYALCLAFLPSFFFPKSSRIAFLLLATCVSVCLYSVSRVLPGSVSTAAFPPSCALYLRHTTQVTGGSSGINHGFIILPSSLFIGKQNIVLEDRPGSKGRYARTKSKRR